MLPTEAGDEFVAQLGRLGPPASLAPGPLEMRAMKIPCTARYWVSALRRREILVQRNPRDTEELRDLSLCTRSGIHNDFHVKLLSIRQDRDGVDIGIWHVWRDRKGEDFVKCSYFCQIPQRQGRITCRLFERHLGECQIS